MTLGKEWKQILVFSLPIIAGNLLQQLYNTVDGVIVGQFVGENAFAGVTASTPLTFLCISFAIGLSVGVGIVVSQFFGAGQHEMLPVSIDTALILLGSCGLFLTVLSFIIAPFMLRSILSVPDYSLSYAIVYVRIYATGIIFQFVYNGVAAILRGLGNSKALLVFLIIATVLNLILDLLFVVVFHWDVAGVAIATVLAQLVCVLISYVYLRKRYPLLKGGQHWDGAISATMTRLGLPIAIQQSVVSIGYGSLQRLVNSFDETVPGVMAAFGAGVRIQNIINAPLASFQSGLASFTGQNIGAGKLNRVYRGYVMTLIMSLITTVVLCVFMYVFAEQLVILFGLTGNAQVIGIEQMRFLSMIIWMFSCYMTLGGLLQGAGDTVLQSITTLSAFGLQVITAYTFVHFGLIGYNAAWRVVPLGWGLAIIISYTRFFTGGWKKKAVAGKLAN